MKLFKTILPLLLLLVAIKATFSHAEETHSTGPSKATLSGIKGVCNGDPVAYMIRQHPEILKHKRDLTLRKGVRTSKHSLQGCVECHSSAKQQTNDEELSYHPIDAKGQFCSDCHEKVGVSLDCFECHRTKPVIKKTGAVNEQ